MVSWSSDGMAESSYLASPVRLQRLMRITSGNVCMLYFLLFPSISMFISVCGALSG